MNPNSYQNQTFDQLEVSGGELAGRWSTENGLRRDTLETARICAALTLPWICPPAGQQNNALLPSTHQSIGARGMMNLAGKLLASNFPLNAPWYQLIPSVEVEFSSSPEVVQQMYTDLYIYGVILQTLLDSAHLDPESPEQRSRPAGFRSRKHIANLNLLITGDVLERIDDDYRIHVYRRDQYVTRRDSCCDVLYHIVRERCDIMQCTDEKFRRDKLKLADGDLKKKSPADTDRVADMFTLVEWQPWTKTWVIRQEIRGEVAVESEEKVSPYFSTPFNLVAGEHYGRGYVETILGDLRTLNTMELRLKEFAAICADIALCLDPTCEAPDSDFTDRPVGRILRTLRVAGGQVVDAAFLKVDKYPDFQVVFQSAVRKRQELGQAMLIEAEVTPQKERTTAYQVQRIANELEGSLGGLQAPIADDQHIPLLRRLVMQARRDNFLPRLASGAVKISMLTGLAALSRQAKLGSILEFADLMQRLGPEMQARLNHGVLINVAQRYAGIYEHNLAKTDEQHAAEQRAAEESQIRQAAAAQAIQSTGNIAEAALTQSATTV